jgi:hypothetical protein
LKEKFGLIRAGYKAALLDISLSYFLTLFKLETDVLNTEDEICCRLYR